MLENQLTNPSTLSKAQAAPSKSQTQLSLGLYRALYLARRAEEFIIRHYPEDEMKTPMHMSFGQEAVPVGVCALLGAQGQTFSSYRTHAPFLARTQDTDKFFAELYGKKTGTAQGKGGSMHLADPSQGHLYSSAVVASSLPAAVGAAFANKRLRTGKIACVFFGDGALEEGAFWESLNAASVMKLPVLFVCEDNGLSVHTPKPVRQGFKSILGVVRQFECSVFEDESNDVECIYRTTQQAVDAIRSTDRPSFLYCRCYRYLEHVGIHEDFDIGYRSRSEFEKWRKKDSLAVQRKRLLAQGLSEDEIKGLETSIDRQIEESIRKAKQADFPGPEELYRGVFHEKN